MTPQNLSREEFIELGADLEHTRWAGWQEYLHKLCIKNQDGSLTIPKERVDRWERQIKTKYCELTEQEKEYDRIEVRKYLPLISLLQQPPIGEEEIVRIIQNTEPPVCNEDVMAYNYEKDICCIGIETATALAKAIVEGMHGSR